MLLLTRLPGCPPADTSLPSFWWQNAKLLSLLLPHSLLFPALGILMTDVMMLLEMITLRPTLFFLQVNPLGQNLQVHKMWGLTKATHKVNGYHNVLSEKPYCLVNDIVDFRGCSTLSFLHLSFGFVYTCNSLLIDLHRATVTGHL